MTSTPPLLSEHPSLSYLKALYRCRELGAALSRYATAATLATVKRSLAAGGSSRRQCYVSGRPPSPAPPARPRRPGLSACCLDGGSGLLERREGAKARGRDAPPAQKARSPTANPSPPPLPQASRAP